MGVMERRRAIMENSDRLPPGYQEYDYLQTSGYNARIDTGVSGDDNTLVFDFTYMRMTNVNYYGAFGNYAAESKRCWRVIQSGTAYPGYYIITAGNRKAGSSTSVLCCSNGTTVEHKVHFRISWGRIEVECDDGYKTTATATDDGTTDVSTSNIAIGSNSVPGTGGNAVNRLYGRFKIWRGGKLIRNYVPSVRNTDNKAGYYDLVNHTFNPSIGTVDFIAGND